MASIRSYINILFTFLILGVMPSCNADDTLLADGDNANVSLTLQLASQSANGTRAIDDPGLDALKENVMKRVDIFFYTKDATPDALPIFSSTDIQLPDNTKGIATLNVSIPVDKYNELFPIVGGTQETECKVYVIVNRPAAASGDNALPADYSLASLRDNTILFTNGFAQRAEVSVSGNTVYKPTVQNDFVMDGFETVTRSGNTITGTIPVERVAAKISLVIKGIADEVTDNNGNVWKSDKNNVRLSLRRGSKRTKLGSTPTEYIYSADKDNDIFRLDAVSLDATMELVEGGATIQAMTTSIPFYTYPTNWKNDENSRTHFIIVVNWTKKDSSPEETLTTYYEVNVNAAGSYTQRNRHYRIYQEIGVLGSTDEETPVVLYPCNYRILDWGSILTGETITGTNASLGRFRYLVVDETTLELNNVASREIFFYSSDPINLTSIDVKWQNTSGNLVSTVTFATTANVTRSIDDGDSVYVVRNTAPVGGVTNRIQNGHEVTLKIHNADPDDDDDRSYIYISHPLDNTLDKDADYSMYNISFKVHHTNDPNYNETINITQYPMLSVIADLNYDYGQDGNTNNNTAHGYVIVNNNTTSSSWYGVYQNGLANDGSNSNPNRYFITVSSLTESVSDVYMIGDPRSKTNAVSNTFLTNIREDYYGNSLTYYYPTRRTEDTRTMVSPEFMVASSYGRCPNSITSLDDAEKRCATYQEDGYPAGRWRLATIAELKYIVQLSGWGIIPSLFSDNVNYWCAHGAIQVDDNQVVSGSTTSGTRVVRCVYDTWYWGKEHDTGSTTFVYGDKEM